MAERIGNHREKNSSRYLPMQPEVLNTIAYFERNGLKRKLVNVRYPNGLVVQEVREDGHLLRGVLVDFVRQIKSIIG